MFRTAVILGSGRLAHAITQRLLELSIDVLQIYSRNLDHAHSLADKLNISCTDQLSNLNSQADIYFICTKDDSISTLSSQLIPYLSADKYIIHSSGMLGFDAIPNYFIHRGVMWPLQSFSNQNFIDWNLIPLFIESDFQFIDRLEKFAHQISPSVFRVTPEIKKTIHLAAVFASNFTNFNAYIAQTILDQSQLPLNILKPLLTETLRKALEEGPKISQTGPAIRNDTHVISEHLKLLDTLAPEFKTIYKTYTETIIKTFHS
ncbi:MAG: DUF2520 domain-containing protein [Saprospiraceae bacterium]|jgi:predicted short-subunit dehydrogenase-like oxidoreductase (DUF2520 family)|nr:DUF2520 domain-containing protein [Saprospiraceae bacterium]